LGKKEWLKEGIGKGLTGLGTVMGLGGLSPWTILIMLIIIAILGVVFWTFIHIYGLVTAFVGFVGGLIFLWFISNVTDLSEHTGLLLTPIILGVLGYFSEHLGIWSAPLNVKINLNSIYMPVEVTIALNIFVLVVIAFITIAQTIITLKD